jgi:hypothetical protein
LSDLDAKTRVTAVLSGVDALVQLLVVRQQLDQREGLTTAMMV